MTRPCNIHLKRIQMPQNAPWTKIFSRTRRCLLMVPCIMYMAKCMRRREMKMGVSLKLKVKKYLETCTKPKVTDQNAGGCGNPNFLRMLRSRHLTHPVLPLVLLVVVLEVDDDTFHLRFRQATFRSMDPS